MPVNDDIADSIHGHTIRLLRADKGERHRILLVLRRLEKDLIARIESTDFGARQATKIKRLDHLLKTVQNSIRDAYREISGSHDKVLAELAMVESEFATRAINQGLGVSVVSTPAAEQIKSLGYNLIQGTPAENFWVQQGRDLSWRFERAMRSGIVEGTNLRDLSKRIRSEVFDFGKRNAEALVRTSFQSSANSARMQTYRANSDVIRGVTFVATMDTRTSDICISMSGLSWDLDGNQIDRTGRKIAKKKDFREPPLHYNCRSTLAPITKSFRELGLDLDEIKPGQRATMDGYAPRHKTFHEWLKDLDKKSPSRVDAMLGPTRAKLWRNGRLSLRNLTDNAGTPLKVSELNK